MVRTVDSFMGWRSASAVRTSSAVQEVFPHTTSMTRCSSSLSGLRGFRALNIVVLQNVAHNGGAVKSLLLGDVVGEIELEDDAVALELGGQRGERVGGADGGDGGLVEGVGAGLKGIRHLADIAALDDGKEQPDLAVPAQFDAFRHNGVPVAANGGEDLRQVGAEVHAHGVALQFQRAALRPRGRRQIDALAIAAAASPRISY